jgi:hypothetical protein
MESYVDFGFYKDEYHGGAIPEADFPALVREASAFLREVTFDRITAPDEDVKAAACAVAEAIHKYGERDGVSSETTGNHSVHYGVGGKGVSLDSAMLKAAKRYLLHTGLMYKGVHECSRTQT